MAQMSFREFEEACGRGNLVPVCREVLADLETPVSVLARFAEDEHVFLLESVEGGERFGRYSFIGVRPRGVFTVEDGKPYLTGRDGARVELPAPDGAFTALRALLKEVVPADVPGLPPLFGGAVGYIGYETVREFESLAIPVPPPGEPSAAMLITDEMIVFDNVRHTIRLVVCVRPEEFATRHEAYEDALRRLEELAAILRRPAAVPMEPPVRAPRPEGNLTRDEFGEMVEKAREQIRAGEAIQVVLSQKFSAPAVSSGLQLYRALRLVNPSPYTFYLKIGDRTLVGSSPETMVKLEDGCCSLRPIAGTRRRGATPAQDRALADELLRDEKERAEHLMLVDLGRNDLGRVARPGSVQVKSFMTVERYSHVMHLVSSVDAVMAEDLDAFDLVRAVFPAGTLSGAPKIRAMELIGELEQTPRGVYGGAVGYFSYTGNLDLAITIRTLELHDGRVTVQTGAGIVYDSDPDREYEETLNKAAAVFTAIRLAANGLELE